MRLRSSLCTSAIVMILITGCSPDSTPTNSGTAPVKAAEFCDCDVSLVALIANPDRYHGRRVRVNGYVVFEFEGNAIYLHHEDARHRFLKNALWLSLPAKNGGSPLGCKSESYVQIEGVFNGKELGHLGLFGGAIDSIVHCESVDAKA